MRLRLLSCLLALAAVPAFAQYTSLAGQNAPAPAKVMEDVKNEATGKMERRERFVPVQRDSYGNSSGTQNDLAVDGAFDGQTVAVLQFYDFPFEAARDALKQKGFSVYRWNHSPPSPKELEEKLAKACQLWVISGERQLLTPEHLAIIKRFFESGKGVYIWGDNDPFYADANAVGQTLLGVTRWWASRSPTARSTSACAAATCSRRASSSSTRASPSPPCSRTRCSSRCCTGRPATSCLGSTTARGSASSSMVASRGCTTSGTPRGPLGT
jgi:hypothetical protein